MNIICSSSKVVDMVMHVIHFLLLWGSPSRWTLLRTARTWIYHVVYLLYVLIAEYTAEYTVIWEN